MDKRRVSPNTVAAAGRTASTETGSAGLTDVKSGVTSAKLTTATTTTTSTTTAGAAGKQEQVPRGRAEPRRTPPSGSPEARTTGTTLCRDVPQLPHVTADLCTVCNVCAELASRLHESTCGASSLLPSGEELRQLVDAVAAIEQDVRAMSTALQSTDGPTPEPARRRDHGVANSSSFTVLTDTDQHDVGGASVGVPETAPAAPGTGRTTAAVALLLPPSPVELSAAAKDPLPASDITTSHGVADGRTTANRPTAISTGQKMTKDTKIGAALNASGRVMVLPPGSNDQSKAAATAATNRQSDYRKYASTPAAVGSRLPFRLAAPQTAAMTQTEDRGRRSGAEETTSSASRGRPAAVKNAIAGRVSVDRPDESPTDQVVSDRPQFSGIQQIIRHLESISSTPSSSTKHSRPTDGGLADSDKKPSAAVTDSLGGSGGGVLSIALRSAGTSPINVVEISTKQTQTSPKSSVG